MHCIGWLLQKYHCCIHFCRVFIAKPSNGILKNDFQLILIQMIPREAKVYDHVVKCQLNSTGVSYLKVLLVALFSLDINNYFVCLEFFSLWLW